jgi:hypothetical protein
MMQTGAERFCFTSSRVGMVSGESPEQGRDFQHETPTRDSVGSAGSGTVERERVRERLAITPAPAPADPFKVMDEYSRTKRLPFSRTEARMLAKELGWDK